MLPPLHGYQEIQIVGLLINMMMAYYVLEQNMLQNLDKGVLEKST